MAPSQQASPAEPSSTVAERRRMMAACASATRTELATALASLGELPPATDLRAAESGLVMLRGRMGGDGRAFNLGEASVSRAAVRLNDGRLGFGYLLGRDRSKARDAALIDALWQGAERAKVETALAPIRARIAAEAARRARQVAATRVEFFTMVRGDD